MFPYKPSTTIQPSSHTFKIFDTWIPHISQSVSGNTENKKTTLSCSRLSGITQEQITLAIQLPQNSRLQPTGSPAPPQVEGKQSAEDMYLQEQESYHAIRTTTTWYPVTGRVAAETSSEAATKFTTTNSIVEVMLKSITDVATDLAATWIIIDPTTADSPVITDSAPIVTISTTDLAKIAYEAATTHHPSHLMITHSQSTERVKASPVEPTSTILQQSQGQDSHTMVTRFQHGVVKPNPKYALTSIASQSVPREPQNVQTTLAYPRWKTAMEEQFAALQRNQT
jgi:hypothetical protein